MGKLFGVIGVLVVGGVLAAIPVIFAPSKADSDPVQPAFSLAAQPGMSEMFFEEKKRAAHGDTVAQF